MRKLTRYVKSYRHVGSRGNLETRTLRSGEQYIDGTIRTEQGIVTVLASAAPDSRGICYVRLDFIHRSRHWISYTERRQVLTKGGLARVAATFTRRVVYVAKK